MQLITKFMNGVPTLNSPDQVSTSLHQCPKLPFHLTVCLLNKLTFKFNYYILDHMPIIILILTVLVTHK